jgi:hypothetical protein
MGVGNSLYRNCEALEFSARAEFSGEIYNLHVSIDWVWLTRRFVSHVVPAGQLMVLFRSSPGGRSLPLSMESEMVLLVVWRTVSCGSATNGGSPPGANITQLIDMVSWKE